MQTFISMLRGINVSGQRAIRMPDLKTLYEALGFVQVATYVQSGNVVFRADNRDETQITRLIEAEIERVFGFKVPVLVRGKEEWQRVIAENPFLEQRNEDPEKLYVTFLSAVPPASILENLTPPVGIRDEFAVIGREIYLFCPAGYGKTKLSNTFFENKLKTTATTRNWRTVTALLEIAR